MGAIKFLAAAVVNTKYLAENATINGVHHWRDASWFVRVGDCQDRVVVVMVVSALQLVPVDTAAVLAEPPQSCSTRHSGAVDGRHVLLLQYLGINISRI